MDKWLIKEDITLENWAAPAVGPTSKPRYSAWVAILKEDHSGYCQLTIGDT